MNKQIAAVVAAHSNLTRAAEALHGSRAWCKAEALDNYKREMRELRDENEDVVYHAESEGKSSEEMAALYARLADRVRALEAKKPAELTAQENVDLDNLIAAHREAHEHWVDVAYSIRCAARKNADLRRSILLEKQFPADLAHNIRRDAERSPSSAMFYYA